VKSVLISLFICAMFVSVCCRESSMLVNSLPPHSSGHGVFIVNEGSYPNAGTVSYYNITGDSVFQNVVGADAGWVTPNDIKVVGKRAYIVVNGNEIGRAHV
jgi:hypothetical protein